MNEITETIVQQLGGLALLRLLLGIDVFCLMIKESILISTDVRK